MPIQPYTTLPVIGDLEDGDVPIWDSELGAFVPGTPSGGGGGGTGGGNASEVLESPTTGWPDRPDTDQPVTWTGWSNPTLLMAEYDRFVAVRNPSG